MLPSATAATSATSQPATSAGTPGRATTTSSHLGRRARRRCSTAASEWSAPGSGDAGGGDPGGGGEGDPVCGLVGGARSPQRVEGSGTVDIVVPGDHPPHEADDELKRVRGVGAEPQRRLVTDQ